MKIRELREISRSSTTGKKEFVCQFQNVSDIVREVKRAEKESRPFAKKLVPFFKKNDEVETCRLVWAFLRGYINYEAEPKDDQNSKTIARFFVDQKGDCKHYSVTSVGILNACNIPAWFSVVRQSEDKSKWHVYASALVKNKIVIVDPCRRIFDNECSYKRKYNVSPKK